MKKYTQQEREELLSRALKLINEKQITAYFIREKTGMSAAGIQKIIDGVTKLPSANTLIAILNAIDSTSDMNINNDAVNSDISIDYKKEIDYLKRSLKDKEDIIEFLKEKLAFKSESEKDNSNTHTRTT